MKRILITMLVALLVIAATQAKPVNKAVPQKHATEQTTKQNVDKQTADETATEQPSVDEQASEENVVADKKLKFDSDGVFINDKDGNTVKVKYGDLGRIISEHLDDTLLSEEDFDVELNDEVLDSNEESREFFNVAQNGMNLARDITKYFAISLVFIVFLALLFYYLHRQRKYKTVDQAIQAGYPLPNEFFGKRSRPMPQQPTTVYVNHITPPTTQQGTTNAQGNMPPLAQSGSKLSNITDWAPFKSGITTTAVGLGLLFFFWILGATPLAALMSIVVFIGLGKLFITYQEQQNVKNYWQQQQWTQQQPQQQQPPQPIPAQPIEQDQPQNIPNMPEPPTGFNPQENA